MFTRQSDTFLAITLVTASAVTHFVASTLLLFLLMAMTLVTYARWELKEPSPSLKLLPYVFITVVIAWLISATRQTFDGLVLVSGEVVSNLQSGQFLRELFIVGRSNFGARAPLWTTILKLFWLFVLLGMGTVAPLPRLRRFKSLPSTEAMALAALLGIILLSVTATLVSTAGSQFLRYPMYAPLVTAPLLVLAICQLSGGMRKLGLASIVVSLVALAVPTFLAHYSAVRMNMFYPYEAAPAQTLSRLGYTTDLRVIAPALGYVPYIGYLPNAEYAPTPILSGLKDEDGVWAYLDNQVRTFAYRSDEKVNIYVLSRRPRIFYGHNFGIPLDAPRWDAIQSRLNGEAVVYDNGFVALYESSSGRGGR